MLNGWIDLKFSAPYYDEMYNDSRLTQYSLTFNRLWRARASYNIKQKICEFFDLELDVGYYKAEPGWWYQFHRDNTRYCAFNQLLCEPDPDYISTMLLDNKILNIPYSNKSLVLINTDKPHNIINSSKTNTRYLLNIGVNNFKKFEDIVLHLKLKNLLK